MSFFRKNKLFFNILATLVFAAGSVFYWFKYSDVDGKKMDLVTAIILAIVTLVKLVDSINYYRQKNKIGT